MAESDVIEKLLSTVPNLSSGKSSLQLHRKLNIFKSCQRTNQVEGLEHKSQFVKTNRSKERVFRRLLDTETANIDVTL